MPPKEDDDIDDADYDLADETGYDPSDIHDLWESIDPDDDLEELFEELAELLDVDIHDIYEWYFRDSP